METEPYIQQDVLTFLKEKEGQPPPPNMDEVSPSSVRAMMDEMFALLNKGGPPVGEVRDTLLAGAFGPRPARLYKPVASNAPSACMIYFHGGGWVIGNLETEDRKLRHIVDESGICVLSVDYVLAPEHPFPGPGDDCIACVRDALNRAGELGIDPDRIFLGGASAGANLALVAALALRDAGIQLAGLLLFYGAFDLTYSGRSMDLLKSGYFLETEAMYRFRRHYCPEESNWRKPEASPLFGNFQGLPRTFISAPTVDPLFNDSTRLADLMEAAGVKVDLQVYEGAIHGFTMFQERFSCARQGVADAAAFLRLGAH
ncbi:MAG TPA: hypothetical protein DCY26_01480 [Hyphomonas sp.]|nr:hypothetical protein [Hyphomonas sp.]